MPFTCQEPGRRIEADPPGARQVDLAPGVEIREVALGAHGSVDRLEIRHELDQVPGNESRRQAEVTQKEQQIASTNAQLARQAEELQKQQRQVIERRGEVDRHLTDMREWYRRKLRELSGIDVRRITLFVYVLSGTLAGL